MSGTPASGSPDSSLTCPVIASDRHNGRSALSSVWPSASASGRRGDGHVGSFGRGAPYQLRQVGDLIFRRARREGVGAGRQTLEHVAALGVALRLARLRRTQRARRTGGRGVPNRGEVHGQRDRRVRHRRAGLTVVDAPPNSAGPLLDRRRGSSVPRRLVQRRLLQQGGDERARPTVRACFLLSPPRCSSGGGLLLIQLPPRVQMVEIQDRVEHQEVAALRLAAPDRVVREQHHVALVERRRRSTAGVLRDLAAAIEQARHQQVARVGVAQDTRGRCAGGITLIAVAQLLVGDRRAPATARPSAPRALSTPARPCGMSGSSAVPRPVGRSSPSSAPPRRPPPPPTMFVTLKIGPFDATDRQVVACSRTRSGWSHRPSSTARRCPMTFSRCARRDRHARREAERAPRSSRCPSTVISRPPLRTKSCRCATPVQPRPGRMSSVSSILPRFGVSAVFFHGSGLPYIGMPLTIACGCRGRPGGKTMTSYFASQVGVLRDVLRADVGRTALAR